MSVGAGDEATSLQTHLQVAHEPEDVGEECPPVSNPVALLRHLEASRHFHRDTGFGRVFHAGSVSLRENEPANSLHVIVDGDHIRAHVDRVSPLGLRPDRRSRYSLRRAAAHNLTGMAHDLVRLLRGRQGDHRCKLDCRWTDRSADDPADDGDLLDPESQAWSLHLEARVGGALTEARLRAALVAALRRGEMAPDALEVVECDDDAGLEAARARLQSTVVRADEWPPLRAVLAHHPGGDVLMLNVNHAAVDGFGGLEVLASVARAYARGSEQEEPLDFLATFDLPVRPASRPESRLLQAYRRSVERTRDLLARPARLAPEDATEEPGYGYHLVRLSPAETRRVVSPERPGTSRNVLIAALHLAIGDWNLEHGTPGRRVGVLIPINLRPPEWAKERLGNFSVTARVSTSRRHRSGRESALEAVTAQTSRNKRTRTGIALIAALDRANLVPLWAKQSRVVLQPLTGNRLVDTAVLSDLGWLERGPSFGADAGETVDIWFSVPARAPLALCIGALVVGNQLHLTFRYPRRLFGPDAARRFAACYLERIRSVGAGPSAAA